MEQLTKYGAPIGRILMSIIFITAGFSKITGYAGTAGYMEMMGVPGGLLPLVILVELVGGIALLVGFQARWAAILLAGFSIISGFLFHYLPAQGMEDAMAASAQMTSWWKNVTIAGGLLYVVAYGPGMWAVSKREPLLAPAE